MDSNILLISFLLGAKEKIFQLPFKSYQKLEAAGQIAGYKYELDVSSTNFLDFYDFVRSKFGALNENGKVAVRLRNLDKGTVEQKKGVPGQPWIHLLVVHAGLSIEKITFYPDICERENEEEDAEYLEDVKRAELVKSLVTTLPEEYRDTDISEK